MMRSIKMISTLLLLVTMAETRDECPGIMKVAGLSYPFAENVAHRLHSLTVEDLRYYFDEDVTEENNIPTVNLDLSTNAKRVLPNAPLSGYDTSFVTAAMRHLDKVLSHMDQTDYGITNYSILEKVVHVMHMSELWTRAKTHYDLFVVYPPSERTCACATDTENNRIMDELQLLALKIKFPGVTSGRSDLPYGKHAEQPPLSPPAADARQAYEISYNLATKHNAPSPAVRRFKRKLADFDFEGEDEDVVERAMEQLDDGDEGLDKHLDGEDGWMSWREGFKAMDDEGNYQFAMFLYCMLN